MRKIETGQQLREVLEPYTLYSIGDLREIIKTSHGVKEIENSKVARILTVATGLLHTDGQYNYFKKR